MWNDSRAGGEQEAREPMPGRRNGERITLLQLELNRARELADWRELPIAHLHLDFDFEFFVFEKKEKKNA
jgi:hypothetical protein